MCVNGKGIRARSGASRGAPESLPPIQNEANAEFWLGGRDSNPDSTVQSRVSYR